MTGDASLASALSSTSREGSSVDIIIAELLPKACCILVVEACGTGSWKVGCGVGEVEFVSPAA